MKKTLIAIMFIFCLMLVGCGSKEIESDAPVNLKEPNGKIVKAKLDDDGNIIINKKDITSTVTYISYYVDKVVVGLIAVKDKEDNIRVVVNTCQSCGGSPYAYFVQVGDKLECQNCGNTFDIDSLGNLVEGGCNPIPIEKLEETEDNIIVGTQQLKNLKEKFKNWKGPKA